MMLDANGRPIGKRGSFGDPVYGMTADGEGYKFEEMTSSGQKPVDIQGHRMDPLDLLSAVSVPAGSDYMNPTVFDFSQYSLIQYGYSTASTGSGTANTFLYALEGSISRWGIKANIGSNDSTFRPLQSPTDIRGYNTLAIGFRNADLQAITVSLKAYCQA